MVDSNTRCGECGESFHCASDDANTSAQCWCYALPPILPLQTEQACLCASCLKRRIADDLPGHLKLIGHDKAVALAEKYSIDTPLEEGIDYHMEEGFMVFSSWYHLKRGYCCDNGCRHCPYPKD